MCVITVKYEGTQLSTNGDGTKLLIYHSKEMKITTSANKSICISAYEENIDVNEGACFRMFEKLLVEEESRGRPQPPPHFYPHPPLCQKGGETSVNISAV